jgi:hypothetical protein
MTNANRAVGQVNIGDNTSNDWYITGVQLEAGTSATDFEFLPIDVSFKRCTRYYQKLIAANTYPNGIITSSDSNYLACSYPYPNGSLRANPTFTSGNIDAISTAGTTTVSSGIGSGLIHGWSLGANSANFSSNLLHRVNFVSFAFDSEL